MEKQCIGLDISSDSFTACLVARSSADVLSYSPVKTFKNEKQGFQQLLRFKRSSGLKDKQVVFLMEATGVYHEKVANFLHDLGETVHIVLANTSKHYFKSLNTKTKTDAVDARLLGRFGIERDHRVWTPPSTLMLKLKGLVRFKLQLQDQKTAMCNIQHSKDRAHGTPVQVIRATKRVLKVLEDQISGIEKEIERVISEEPELEKKVADICTTGGLGAQTVAGVLAETDCFTLFTSAKQLASYAGYDVVHNESGTIKGATRISKKGNRYIRRMMYLPAMSASRCVPEFVALRTRIREKSGIPMKAQVAIQRKLLILLYTLWKNGTQYEEGYYKNKVARAKAQATQDSALALP